jgi:iron complex outermembrane receptor protein
MTLQIAACAIERHFIKRGPLMKTSLRHQLLASSVLVGVALAISPADAREAAAPAAAAPAQDQVAPAPLPTPTPTADETKDVIVTGSHIRRPNFDTPQSVNVITRDDRILSGSRSIADALQSSVITSGTSQINGAFLGFVSEGGAAAETVGLRGLGSSRTLVLLNGRRLAPAGVGPQLVSADLNTLPSALVARVDVLRQGASSVYGSDAIAGVINIITDTKVNGVTLDLFTDQPIEHGGGGRTTDLSITAGKVFDRGHITGSFEYKNETGLRVGDRPEFACPRDYYHNAATGQEVGSIDTATGQLACFPYTTGGGTGTASGYGIASSFTLPGSRLTYANGNINNILAVNGINRVSPSPMQLQDHLISPVKIFTGYVNGAYELGMLGDAEIYGEGLFTRRDSYQDSTYQLNLSGSNLSPNNQIYGGSYAGTPLGTPGYGYPTSPFYPNSVANAGYQVFTPFVIPDRESRSSQRVDFYRANGGVKGSIGLGDWRYDANFQYSETKASETLEGQINVNHLNNALQAVLAPAGTPANLITTALPGQAGAGNNYTCASNVSNNAIIAGASCVPLNLYDPNIMIGGHIPANVYNYLFGSFVDRTTFRQETVSLNFDGTLFNLPAGPVKGAVGFEHRYDFINDTPSAEAQAGLLYNRSSGGITTGSDEVNEVYGEIDAPLLKDQPFAKLLEIDPSVRYTHYRSYGADTTFHVNGQWAINDIIRFRGDYGTSFRAPNLYEQYVAAQTGFYGGSVDPCNGFGAFDPTSTVYKNCLTALTPILGANAVNYIATSGPQVTTTGGAGTLKAEHSTSYGFGVVLTLPRAIADFSFAVDYYHITVKDEVTNLGNLILDRCYEATDFGPTNPYCALIDPRRPANDSQRGTLQSFRNPYLNVAEQGTSGIDFDLRYSTGLLGGKFLAKVEATRSLHQTFQLFTTDPSVDYNGTLGVQGAGAGPKWVGNLDLRYDFPGDKFTFHYGLTYVGPQDSTPDAADTVQPPFLTGVAYDLRAEAYYKHDISVQFRWKDTASITFGVNNLFNTLPPTLSSYPTSAGQFTRVGNYFNSSNYDLIGRSLFLRVIRTF